MPDNSFVIKAVVDVQQLADGMNEAGKITKQSIEKMKVDWTDASTATARAVKKISDDTLAAALTVNRSFIDMSSATLAHKDALKEVSGATYLAVKAGQENANELAVLAAANEKAALTGLQLKETQEILAGSTAKVAGAMGMARVEAGALDGSMGMVAGGLARLAGSSEALAPIIQAAFVPFAVAAFADIIFQAGEKVYKLYQNVVLNKAEFEALNAVEKSVTDTTKELSKAVEQQYIDYLKLIDPIEAAREKMRAISSDEFKFKINDKELKELPQDFGKFVSTLSDFPASQLDEKMRQVAGSIVYLQEKLSAPLLRGTFSREELQGQLKLLQDISKALDEFGTKVSVQQKLGGADLDKEKVEQQKKAEEAERRAADASNEEVARAAHNADELKKSHDSVKESLSKSFREKQQIAEQESEFFSKSAEKDTDVAIREAQKQSDAQIKYHEEYLRIVEQSALQQIGAQEAVVTGDARLQQAKLAGTVTSEFRRLQISQQIDAQELAGLEALEDEKLAVRLKALEGQKAEVLGSQTEPQFQASNVGNDEQLGKLLQINGAIESAKQAHVARMQQFNLQETLNVQSAANRQLQIYLTTFQTINQGFVHATEQIIDGTTTISRAFERMAGGILMSVITSLEQIILKHIEAAAEIQIISAASALLQIMKHAAVAAAGAFAAMAGIPVVGPALGDAAAADSLATVMGFAAVASADKGMVSNDEQLAFIHRNEMVLPAPLSMGFQHIISNMNAPAAAGAGADGGGGITHNYGGVNISAFDSKGIADMIHRNQGEFTRAAAGIVRNGWRGR